MSFGWSFTGGGGLRRDMATRFEEQFHCFSVAYAGKGHLEGGDKILLPPSAFDTLARLQVDYPMLFRLESSQKGTLTHCGVLEFTAEEGSCFIPFWMMQNLLIEEGTVISVTNVSLPKATFVKLQPQHVDFLEITNPRAVLEHALRNFSCVTKGDVICVPYMGKNFHFELKEVQPTDAACIIETDCNVDFDAPIGYKEPNTFTGSNGAIDGDSSASSSLVNLPKQSAYASAEARSSACPSPALSSMSGASFGANHNNKDLEDGKPKAASVSIVDGKIVRPVTTDEGKFAESTMLATRKGATGVQENAAIAVKAPEIDYWAINAGDGARLDGKQPTALKDKQGNVIDVRKLRAEAAAKRMAALVSVNMPSVGTTVDGKSTPTEEAVKPAVPVSKRKSRVAGKFSRLKHSGGFAFEGSSNQMNE